MKKLPPNCPITKAISKSTFQKFSLRTHRRVLASPRQSCAPRRAERPLAVGKPTQANKISRLKRVDDYRENLFRDEDRASYSEGETIEHEKAHDRQHPQQRNDDGDSIKISFASRDAAHGSREATTEQIRHAATATLVQQDERNQDGAEHHQYHGQRDDGPSKHRDQLHVQKFSPEKILIEMPSLYRELGSDRELG